MNLIPFSFTYLNIVTSVCHTCLLRSSRSFRRSGTSSYGSGHLSFGASQKRRTSRHVARPPEHVVSSLSVLNLLDI